MADSSMLLTWNRIRESFVFKQPVDVISQPLAVRMQKLSIWVRSLALLLSLVLTIGFSFCLIFGIEIGRHMPSSSKGLTPHLSIVAYVVITTYDTLIFHFRTRYLNQDETFEIGFATYALIKSSIDLSLGVAAIVLLIIYGPNEDFWLLITLYLKTLIIFIVEIATGGQSFTLTIGSGAVTICYGWAWNNSFGAITGLLFSAFIYVYTNAFEWRRECLDRLKTSTF
ncbi:hypothetical protein M5689_006683 [Euphorbia peplus]|nr:hypothetical protein M5689_006683 [Euphorbia peplus]